MAYYKGDNPEGKTLREMAGDPIDCAPAFREPAPRLAVLDELGVHRALMFPTLANLLEYSLDGDPDLTHVAIHAVNEWLHDVWTYDYQDRIFTVPVITLPIVEEAIKELEWVLERGTKAILIRPAPATGLRGSRSIGLPEFDPFWARVQEAGIPVCMHASFPPLSSYYETWEPGRSDSAFKPTPLKNLLLQHREIEDALAALLCQNTLSRFPDLKIFSVENGASWVGHLLEQLDLTYRKMPQEFDEDPVHVFQRNVYVSPFWEDDIASLVELVGPNHVLFGSDYPHPEGLAEPLEYLDYLDKSNIDDADQRRIMSENGNRLLGLTTP
jgi:predicted TIM-barrel fold metal-dependent hydrolase